MKEVTSEKRLTRIGLPLLLTIHAVLLAYGANLQSPTLNEPGHLVAGLSNWQFGRFDIYRVNPPLVRMVAALPILLSAPKTNWHNFFEGPGARPEFTLGEDFIAANGLRSFWLFTLARWSCVPFSLVGGYFCFRWARELYGAIGSMLALTLWCFSPNILGHGQLITPDVAATSLGLTACYSFWCWLKEPTWWRTLISGLILGIAELTKTTLMIYYPLWFLMWPVYRWFDRRTVKCRDWLRELGMLTVCMLIGLYIINLGYGFEGSFTHLRDFRFVSAALATNGHTKNVATEGGNRFAGSWLGSLPVLLPTNYLLGIDQQKRDFEEYYEPSYLRGEFQDRGWWYYYLYALAIKVPIGTWLLLLLAATIRLWKKVRVSWRDEFILLSPAIVILTFVSSQTGFSEHMRYVLPAFPFVFVWIGRLGTILCRRHWIMTSIATLAMGWSIVSSLMVYPHSLSYFNELVGGPTSGADHLINSNIDWGQDLLSLKKWLNMHQEARPLRLAYFGSFDPKYAGIEYSDLEDIPSVEKVKTGLQKIPPGWYAISVNFVRGLPNFTYKGDGSSVYLQQYVLAAFQQLKPVAMAGYSIYIYHVE